MLAAFTTHGSQTGLQSRTHRVDIVNLVWSPDGTRLAFGSRGFPRHGIYVVAADGLGLSIAIPDGLNPYWSPDGSRISYQQPERTMSALGTREIAPPDGTHVQSSARGGSEPWNPLVQPEPEVAPEAEVAEVPPANHGLTLTSTLLLVVSLLALVAGAVLMRRRRAQRS
ncbi:MAG TPA: hypothetical protein VGL16_11125 [Actinomycetota bacterium]|jgi:dipeptidyl aminopeptidase/acylaminoacyl peptidase